MKAASKYRNPPHGQTKAQRRPQHRIDMAARRERQLARQSSFPMKIGRCRTLLLVMPTKNNNPAYRKSIWTAAKIERRRVRG